MFRALALKLLGASCLVVAVSAIDNEYVNCNCDEEGFWSVYNILWFQRVSDFLIAVAYFSIPIELLYFVSCSNFPFKWVLLQFIAFIVLCGLTHLLNGWTYYGPHSFQLMMSLTVSKFLTALVSCATAITLLTLIPLLLKVKVRELFLRQNVLELDQEVGIIKRQKEANLHVRMLTQEIRKSLDKHTILDTTLVELSKTLDLHNCAVWMPNEGRTEMNLARELRASSGSHHLSIPIDDPDVVEIKHSKGVKLLGPDSALGAASGGEAEESGAVAAIRMPLLRVSNFKGGTPELVDPCYAILVLLLPSANSRIWGYGEMEIVEVVADQVAVALSHANVLEESQLMRETLSEQNRALQQAKMNAMMASQARNSFQKVMSHGMRRPMHSIMGFISMFVDENVSFEQRLIVDTLVKTSNVLSTLINDVMDISTKDAGRFPLEMRPFQLHSTIKEASCLAKCFCVYKGFGFEVDVQSSLPNMVLGDERRAFQVILHMVGYLLNIYDGGVTVIFRVSSEKVSGGNNDRLSGMWKTTSLSEHVSIKFEFQIKEETSLSDASISAAGSSGRRLNSGEVKEGLSFRMCQKLVQMMQGDIWITSNALGFPGSMTLLLRLQTQSPYGRAIGIGSSSEQPKSNSQFKGLRVILADDDDVNRIVTSRMLRKLGCEVTAVSSGFECLSTLCSAENSFRIVFLDLHMPEMDGFEVAMRIRKFCSRNWPLIIALSASAEDNVWERCLQMGMNGVVQKPVPLQGMADELRRVLQRAGEGFKDQIVEMVWH